MASVRCVGYDSQRRVSYHRWVVAGAAKLNRRNKASSGPFDVPGPLADGYDGPVYQFRLVAVRGLVKGATEEEDPVAVFVEYLPAAADAAHPQGVRVKVTCVNATDEKVGVSLVEGLSFDAADRTLIFRELLPSVHLYDEAFCAGGALILELELELGANLFTGELRRATQGLTSSLWSGAASTFGALSAKVADVARVVTTSSQEAAAAMSRGDVGPAEPEPAAPVAVPTTTLPWEVVPPKWRGREERWRALLCDTLPQHEVCFLVGPERGFSAEEQLLMTQAGLSANACAGANPTFDFEADVRSDILEEQPGLRAMRYSLVPRVVSDAVFWKHYFWRIACLSVCATHEQAAILTSILCAPPPPPRPSSPQSDARAPSVPDSEVATALAAAFDAARLCRDVLSDAPTREDPLLVSARQSCAKALQGLRGMETDCSAPQRTDVQEAVAELSSVLADADAVSTESPPPEVAAATAKSESPRSPSPAPSEGAAAASETTPSPLPPQRLSVEDIFEDDGPSPSPPKAGSAEPGPFAKMPWEEDE